MAGVALVFAGFLVLGVFGDTYRSANVQSTEFGDCIEYTDRGDSIKTDCNEAVQSSVAFFALVLGLLGAGIFALIKGYRGRWDNEAKPEDMLGPGFQGGEKPPG